MTMIVIFLPIIFGAIFLGKPMGKLFDLISELIVSKIWK